MKDCNNGCDVCINAQFGGISTDSFGGFSHQNSSYAGQTGQGGQGTAGSNPECFDTDFNAGASYSFDPAEASFSSSSSTYRPPQPSPSASSSSGMFPGTNQHLNNPNGYTNPGYEWVNLTSEAVEVLQYVQDCQNCDLTIAKLRNALFERQIVPSKKKVGAVGDMVGRIENHRHVRSYEAPRKRIVRITR